MPNVVKGYVMVVVVVVLVVVDKNAEEEEVETNEENGNQPLSLGDAFYYVHSKRNIICPNQSFCRQLTDWEDYLHCTSKRNKKKVFESSASLLPMYRNRFLQGLHPNNANNHSKKCLIL